MAWKMLKLPKLSMPPVAGRFNRPVVKRLSVAGLVAIAMVGAFYVGRHGGMTAVRAQSPELSFLRQAAYGDTSGRPAAFIYGDTAITREELGAYLVDRVGAERIDFLVNRRIIERACAAKNIIISEAEIDAQFQEDLEGFKCSKNEFVNNILRKYNKTLFEWREDVIRPKLALQRYVKDSIRVTEEDVRNLFEAKYGPKKDCRIIVIPKEQYKDKDTIYQRARSSPAEFEKCAKEQSIGQFASEGGKIPPIHKHFADSNVEQQAFKLDKGDISPLIHMSDGSMVILKCVDNIPADPLKSLDTERMALNRELFDMKMTQMMPLVFNELRKTANPQIMLRRDSTPAPMVAQMPQVPQMPASAATAPGVSSAGNGTSGTGQPTAATPGAGTTPPPPTQPVISPIMGTQTTPAATTLSQPSGVPPAGVQVAPIPPLPDATAPEGSVDPLPLSK